MKTKNTEFYSWNIIINVSRTEPTFYFFWTMFTVVAVRSDSSAAGCQWLCAKMNWSIALPGGTRKRHRCRRHEGSGFSATERRVSVPPLPPAAAMNVQKFTSGRKVNKKVMWGCMKASEVFPEWKKNQQKTTIKQQKTRPNLFYLCSNSALKAASFKENMKKVWKK